MKKFTALTSVLPILGVLVSCSDNFNTKLNNKSESTITESTLTLASSALKDLSPAFADVILNSDNLLGELKSRSKLMEDGDYDVLFNDVKYLPIEKDNGSRNASGKTFLAGINNKFKTSARSADGTTADDLISSIPDFNLFFYSPDYEKEFDSSNILVTYLDYTVDEFEQTTLTAYDKNGNVFELDGLTPPDFPVIVLGINERTSDKNYVKFDDSSNRAVYDGSVIHDENVYGIDYYPKYGAWDPWPRGYPEIYLVYAFEGSGQCIKQYFPEVDKPKYYGFGNGTNFSFRNFPANSAWKIQMYDEDIGSILDTSVNLNYVKNGLSISTSIPLKIKNGDDFMGETELDFYHPQYHKAKIGSVATITLSYRAR